jgi:hypothetical protein
MLNRILFRIFGDGFEQDWWLGFIQQVLSILVVVALLTVAGLWFLGGQTSEYEGKVNIEAPADAIFAQLISSENRSKWQTEAASIVRSPDKLEAKSLIKLRLHYGSQVVDATDEVMRIDAGEWYSYRTTAPHLSRVTVFKIKAALDPETDLPIPNTLELSCRATQKAVDMSRFWAAFSKPNVKARVDAELALIKEQAEAAARSKSAE